MHGVDLSLESHAAGEVERRLVAIENLRKLLKDNCPPEVVHDLRVTIKQLRAIIRLFYSGDRKRLKKANHTLARFGRVLGELRDQRITAEQVTGILADRGVNTDVLAELVARLAPDLAPSGFLKADHPQLARIMKVSKNRSRRLRPRLEALAYCDDPVFGLAAAIPEYCRSIADDAVRETTPGVWHEWRKHIKIMSYQLGSLQAWQSDESLVNLQDKVKLLGSLLGKLNDMAVVSERLASASDRLSKEVPVSAINTTLIDLECEFRMKARKIITGIAQSDEPGEAFVVHAGEVKT